MRALVALAAIGVIVLTGCSDSGIGSRIGVSGGDSNLQTGATFIAITKRESLPDVSGSTLEGEALALADYEGQVLVINVWGSWCAPCRAEAPVLAEVSKETRSDGVRFVGINTRDQTTAALAFEANYDIKYPSLIDEGGTLTLALSRQLPANAIPSTLVVDRAGNVAGRIIGATQYAQLKELVLRVAKESMP